MNDSNPDIFVFYYNFLSDVNDIVKRIQERHGDATLQKILFALTVGQYNDETYVGNTVVGKKVVSGCHFSMGVYYTEQNILLYGDSQGWPIPESVVQNMHQLLTCIVGRQKSLVTTLSTCHVPRKRDIIHSCNKDCWRYYPLQTCTHICGVSAIISMCLAASPDDSVLSLKGTPEEVGKGFDYLKTISNYSDFLRLIVVQWLINKKIDISALRCGHIDCHKGNSRPGGEVKSKIAFTKDSKQDSTCSVSSNEQNWDRFSSEQRDMCTPYSASEETYCRFCRIAKNSSINSFVEACEVEGRRKCNLVDKHYHCTLYPPWKQFPSLFRIRRHICQTHINPARTFEYDGFPILPCKQEHGKIKYSESRYHYHCPVCNKTVLHRSFLNTT